MRERSQDMIEVSIEDNERQIELIQHECKKIEDSELPQDIKNEFVNRLFHEIEWIEQINEDDKQALTFMDDKVNAQMEEFKLNKALK